MKKSNIITKITLALVMLCLAFALVACGGGGGGSSTPSKPSTKPGKTQTKTFSEHLSDIAESVDALLDEAKAIKNGTAYLALGLGVNYQSTNADTQKVSSGSYKLDVKGNVRKQNPELDISFTAPKANDQGTVTDENFEWFRLALSNYSFYLKQPLTAVNTAADVDSVQFNESGLKDAADELMDIALDFIQDLVGSETVKNFSLKTMLAGDSDSEGGEDEGSEILDALGNLLEITATKTGWEAVAVDNLWSTIGSLTKSIPVVGGMIPDIIDNLTANGKPTLKITIDKTGDKVSKIKIGYYFLDGDFGEIVIDLSLSASTPVTLASFSGYDTKALHANVTATAAQKNLQAALDAYVNANLTAASGNYVGYATLKAADKDGSNAQTSYGIVKDGLAAFDLAPVFEKLGSDYEGATNFKANIQSEKETENGLVIEKPTLVEWLENAAHSATAAYEKYKADKAAGAEAGEEEGEEEIPENVEYQGEQGLMVNIYEWLGGDLKKLEPANVDRSKEWSYNDPTEQQMMAALKVKIGNYVNFEIDDNVNKDSKGKQVNNNYVNTVKNIAKLVGANDQWILGFKLVDNDKVDDIAALKDFTDFSKWVSGYTASTKSISAWADANVPSNTGYKKYGIVDWNVTNYFGGMVVYSAAKTYTAPDGENAGTPGDDLLDAINVFVKIPHTFTPVVDGSGNPVYENNGKQKQTPSDFSAITVADVADLLNNNICKAAKYFGIEVSDEYDFEDAANKATNVALTKQVVEKAIGYETEAADVITELINNGLYIEIGSKPNAGIYGFIAIYNVAVTEGVAAKGNTEYAKLEGSIGFVDNNVADVAARQEAALIKETTVDLNGVVAPVLEDGEETGEYEVTYPNADSAFDMLFALWEAYVAYDNLPVKEA